MACELCSVWAGGCINLRAFGRRYMHACVCQWMARYDLSEVVIKPSRPCCFLPLRASPSVPTSLQQPFRLATNPQYYQDYYPSYLNPHSPTPTPTWASPILTRPACRCVHACAGHPGQKRERIARHDDAGCLVFGVWCSVLSFRVHF